MKKSLLAAIPVLSAGLTCAVALAQLHPQPVERDGAAAAGAGRVESGPVVLDWTPAALEQLSSQAAMKSSFSLDRTLLAAAAGMTPDSEPETRQAINKLDGVSVRVLRFGAGGRTDLWLVVDGVTVRGAVALVETPMSLTLVTLKGDLSPADLFHLRGHFGIPR